VKVGSFHCQIRERLVCNQLYVWLQIIAHLFSFL
jgi:hypothetical protein